MRRIAYIITVVVFLQIAPSISSLEEGTGLETGGDMRVYVIVARKIGLTRQLIQSKVELQLRRNGITPTTAEASLELGYYLYINVNVIDSSSSTSVEFIRIVTYIVDDKIYKITAATWTKGSVVTHSNAKIVIDQLLDDIDIFCNEFLSVNEK